jgi:hypothetical protein
MRYETWYALNRPRVKNFFENPKIIAPDICERSEFTLDDEGEYYIGNTGYGIVPINNTNQIRQFLLAVLNSSAAWFYIYQTSTVLENDFRRFLASYLRPIPIPQPDLEPDSADYESNFQKSVKKFETNNRLPRIEERGAFLSYLGGELTDLHKNRNHLNLALLDYLGTYSDGPTLGEMDHQPPSGLASSVLTETATSTDFETLRVTAARVERDGGDVRVLAVPYVKPTDEEEYETNSRGYATLDPVPAMELFDLSDAQADLVETFVPYAVEEADGFAGYRDNATATISPLDRLEGLTLPALADVENGIEGYVERRERAAELDEQIERTDELIDEIVYELYGLTDEEIEIVEETVGT